MPARERLLPWEETDPEEQDAAWLGVAGFAEPDEERDHLAELIVLASAAEHAPSKIGRLQRFIRRIHEPAIVFSEFRDTLEAIRSPLEAVAPVTCLHGDLDVAERRRRLARFLDGEARVLLTTDVAGEGLNLHRAARLVITVEWPWSPLRLEQRIGRVHRLGQTRRVHAIHLTAAGSYESVVVTHVATRASRAADALTTLAGRAERTVASLVLGLPDEATGDGARPPDSAGATSQEGEAVVEARRIERLRALSGPVSIALRGAAWCPPARGASRRIVVLVEVSDHVSSGIPRGTHVVAVVVGLRDGAYRRRTWRVVARQLARDPRVRQAALDAVAGGRDQWSAVRGRLRASRDVVHAARVRPEVQPSLFDRRALQAAERRQEALSEWNRWYQRMESRLAPGPLSSTTRVRAVLPLHDHR